MSKNIADNIKGNSNTKRLLQSTYKTGYMDGAKALAELLNNSHMTIEEALEQMKEEQKE